MKITKIVLENIGPYVKQNEFNFDVSSKKNIILIGGKNGSGKTTLLKAIKYGLFGSFCLGLKNDTKKYIEEISNLINTDKKHPNHAITIYLIIYENYKANEYVIKRSWDIENNNISENLKVSLNDEELNDYQILEFYERLKSFTSPQLINSFIFDGEKIGNIIENNEVNSFLESTFTSIFNITLLNQLNTDLNSYLEKKANENISSKDRIVYELMKELSDLKNKIKEIENSNKELSIKLFELNIKKKKFVKDFFAIGGLNKAQQAKLINETGDLAKQNINDTKKLKSFIENKMCFTINKPLLKSLSTQLVDEIPYHYLDEVSKIEKYLNVKLNDLNSLLSAKLNNKDLKIIHNIDENSSRVILGQIKKLLEEKKVAKYLLDQKGFGSERLELIKTQLEKQEDVAKLDELAANISETDELLNYFNNEHNQNIKKQNELENLFKQKYNDLDTINKEINKENLYNNSFNLTKKAIDINNKYINYIIKSKLEKVSKLTLKIFNETIRKENYIKDISIDENYNIHLFDNNNKEMNIKKLSAGEMQLIISSIIWSMFKLSGRQEMFVFDTPLARLDYENRIAFINNIVKTISDQVIILSTDSEIIGENLDAIESNVFEKYRLDYIEKTKSTTIKKGYF